MDYCTSTNIKGQERWWLAVININTKFLFMYPLEINTHATEEHTAKALTDIQKRLPEDQKNENLRTDAGNHFPTIISEERGALIRGNHFAKTTQSEAILDFLKKNNIKFFPFSSQFTNKSRVVDRAIRTIRDMIGDDFNKFFNPQAVSEVVDMYNNTPHRAFNYIFTPTEVQNNKDIEEFFIRENLYKLDDVRNKQIEAGFLNYKPGDILLVHKDPSKISFGVYRKKRRTFNCLARFVHYVHGNAVCREGRRDANGIITFDYDGGLIEVPVFDTRLIAHRISKIPHEYLALII
jgi:hypothetical protein